jgi:hypothetical protein
MSNIALEQRTAASILAKQNQYFTDELGVVRALRFQKLALFVFRQIGSFVKERLDSLPGRVVHRQTPPTKRNPKDRFSA